MPDQLTAVIDRGTTEEAPRRNRKKRVWLILLACAAALALTATATFAVRFYLSLQEQLKISAQQTQQLTSLQQAVSEQADRLQSQQDALDAQQSTIDEQQSRLDAQQSQIAAQESQIAAQQDKIAAQQSTISQQQAIIRAKAANQVKATVLSDYSKIDATPLKGKKLVALTFDDGPGPYTARLLDALKTRGARATFFVVGTRVNGYASLIKRMEAEGHAVGNHTTNHKNLKYLSAAGMAAEINTTAARIKSVLGHDPLVLRCPGGNYNAAVRNHAASVGVPIIQWSVDTIDWRDRNQATVLSRGKTAKDGSIVLMHDLYSTTVNAAIQLVDHLQAQGYTLVTVPELLVAKYGTVEPGKVYFHG